MIIYQLAFFLSVFKLQEIILKYKQVPQNTINLLTFMEILLLIAIVTICALAPKIFKKKK